MTPARPHRPLLRASRGGFALLEVIALAAILGLAVVVLQRTLLAAEGSIMQSRVEAVIGRALRYHANVLLNCAYDQLPPEGDSTLESGHAFRPFVASTGSYETRLPFEVRVSRRTTDADTDAERAELQLRIEYSVPADPGAASGELPPARRREHPVILRRPAMSQ